MTTIAIRILDKEYHVNCEEEEKQDLILSAKHLDQKMRETKQQAKTLGTERIVVLTALNISYELLQQQHQYQALKKDIKRLERKLKQTIDS